MGAVVSVQPCGSDIRSILSRQRRHFSSDGKDNKDDKQQQNNNNNNAFWSHWWHELQSPPNIITTTRILSTPLLSYWIITGHHEWAVGGCILAAVSDYVDGYLAKHHDMQTTLGSFLDPLADKIFINVLAGSLWYIDILPTPLVALWLARDVLLLAGTATHLRLNSKDATTAYDPTTAPFQVNPTLVSKVNTALQFITVGVGIVYPLSPTIITIPPEVLTGLCYMTGATTVASGFSYLDYSAFSDNSNNDKRGQEESSELGSSRSGNKAPHSRKRKTNTMQGVEKENSSNNNNNHHKHKRNNNKQQ